MHILDREHMRIMNITTVRHSIRQLDGSMFFFSYYNSTIVLFVNGHAIFLQLLQAGVCMSQKNCQIITVLTNNKSIQASFNTTMRRDSTSRLLPDNDCKEVMLANTTRQPSVWATNNRWPFLMINLIVVLLGAAGRFHTPVLVQYLYQRYADEILGNASVKTSR